ncbi:Arc family DNA-binding protein [Bradyrhizobium sp. 190]|nr:Arc family DNA-binding protein [Bradyrhizobium sp. 190]
MDELLVKSAENSGRSVSEEIEYRLERSFSEEGAFGGGPVKHMAIKMAVAFGNGGRAAACANGHPGWTAAEWILDSSCYRTATFAVIESLLKVFPGANLTEILQVADSIPLMVEALKSDAATHFVNSKRALEEDQ